MPASQERRIIVPSFKSGWDAKIFLDRIENASSLSKEKIARQNITMFCAINVGLRGGDFCSLKWSDIFDKNWDYKTSADYVPEKTIQKDEDGNMIDEDIGFNELTYIESLILIVCKFGDNLYIRILLINYKAKRNDKNGKLVYTRSN